MGEIDFTTAANGHLWISTESRAVARRIRRLLTYRHFFYRWGVYVPAYTDEAIYPDFRRGRLRIASGWDNWVGYDFLSMSDATDRFLRRFMARHYPKVEEKPRSTR